MSKRRFATACAVLLVGACTKSTTESTPDAEAPSSSGAIAISSAAPSTEFGNFGKAIATDAAGYVDVVWMQGGATAGAGAFVYSGPASIAFAQSPDGGVTWTTTSLANSGLVTSLPRIAASGSDLYVVWP